MGAAEPEHAGSWATEGVGLQVAGTRGLGAGFGVTCCCLKGEMRLARMVPAGVCRAGVAPLLGSVRRALAAETSRVLPAVRGLVCSRALVPQPLRSSMWAATARPHAPSRAPAVKSMPVRRMVSAEHGATVDGSELDPYLPHRVNLEKAKEYIKANVSEGMSRDEVAEVVKQAMELHIPPVPSLEELLQQEESAQKLEKQQRLQKDLERSKEEALRRIPTVDSFGRAYATGRRKTATARVWVTKGAGNVTVNRLMMVDYFKRITLRDEIFRPLQVVGGALSFDVWATVSGGGLSAQAGAIRLGVARALQAFNADYRTVLKEHRLLTQDDRKVERKKPGQPKARKNFQWVKR